jgi:hypothetical protein
LSIPNTELIKIVLPHQNTTFVGDIKLNYFLKVSGFTFIKNALKYDYPIVEAITSILPICDEFVIAVGESEDGTLDLIKQIDSDKIRIIETQWDESLREGGKVLAIETNKAFSAVSEDSDWAFYIQGDEVIHEDYLSEIQAAMELHKDNKTVDGLLFNYLHFYGSTDYVGSADNWYPQEIRIIRNDPTIYSYKDAQGFRKGNNEKLRVKPIEAYVYHYGWVKEPKAMQRKQVDFNKLWHDDHWIEKNIAKSDEFDYMNGVNSLYRFTKSHPSVMKNRILSNNWKFNYDISFNKRSLKARIKGFFKKYLGWDLGHNNYIKV